MKLGKPLKWTIYAFLMISGFTGLVYELIWTRLLTTIFGSTTYAITAVLAAYMGGLAIGSFFIGRTIEEKKAPVLIFALLEIGIGLTAALTPTLFRLLDRIYPLIYRYTTASSGLLVSAKFVLSLLVILVPTFLMGGTLPVLCKLFIHRPKDSGRQVGTLYAVNTLGAALGCFITGFVLIELVGVTTSLYLAALGDCAIGSAFIILHRRRNATASQDQAVESANRPAQPDAAKSHSRMPPLDATLVLVGFFLAGFVSLSYELLWTRLLVFKLKMTVYAFSIMLTTFLTGLGLGSMVAAAIERKGLIKHHAKAFGMLQALIGMAGILTIVLFSQIGSISLFDRVGLDKAAAVWSEVVFFEILLAGMIMIVPTVLMGMTFPLVSRIFTRDIAIVGRTVGSIYAVNTLGGILGSCLTGFVLVKTLGTQNTMVLVSLISLVIGTLIVLFHGQGERQARCPERHPLVLSVMIWVISLGAILVLPKDLIYDYYNIYEEQSFQDAEIVYAKEGIEGITTVHRYPDGFKGISASSVNVAGTHYTHRTTQKLQAHVPMLVHPHPQEVLQVGFGSGETSHIVTTYDIERLDVVEISGEVIDTATLHFQDINKGVAHDTKFHPIIMDGANYIYLTDIKYDLILNDASWPGYTGCSALYSQDYFRDAKKRLKPGGMMTSWFPITEEEDFRILLRTFHSVFPHVSVWFAMTHVNKHALVLGSVEPIEIDTQEFLRRFEQYAREDLVSVDLDDPILFLDLHQMDETVLGDAISESTPTHTLDRPILEFTERSRDAVENIGAIRDMVEHNVSIASRLRNGQDASFGEESLLDALEHTRGATQLVMRGYLRVMGSGEYQPQFESEFKEALVIRPDHPGANHFFYRMFDIHTRAAAHYAESADHEYAAYCYRLALQEMDFYIALRPDSARAHFERGLVYFNGGAYLGLEKRESLVRAQDDFSEALALGPEFAAEHDVAAWMDLIEGSLNP